MARSKSPARATASSLDWLVSLPPKEKAKLAASLTEAEAAELEYVWPFWARPEQMPPAGDWRTWAVIAGRGFGKTRTGAEWIRGLAESGKAKRIALLGATAADTRDVMVKGPAGLLAISSPSFLPVYRPSLRLVEWPNGAQATLFSADEPERLRGPQHDAAWVDELGAYRYPDDAWSNLEFGLRLGDDPRAIVTTTPRPTKKLREILADATTTVTRGSTFANRANLAPQFLAAILKKYEGTRLGLQEIEGRLLDDAPGALWKRAQIDALRVSPRRLEGDRYVANLPDMVRVVVAVDPSVSDGEDSDECGIVVAGLGSDGIAYVLDDLSARMAVTAWSRLVVDTYNARQADRVIAETNQGGDLVEASLRAVQPGVSYASVRAKRAKVLRAEPVAALYEQRRVRHVGAFGALEDQMCGWDPTSSDASPDRVDALVYALTHLLLDEYDGNPNDLPAFGDNDRR